MSTKPKYHADVIRSWVTADWMRADPTLKDAPPMKTAYENLEEYKQAFPACVFDEIRCGILNKRSKIDPDETVFTQTQIIAISPWLANPDVSVVQFHIMSESSHSPKPFDVYVAATARFMRRINSVPLDLVALGFFLFRDPRDPSRFAATFTLTDHTRKAFNVGARMILFRIDSTTTSSRILDSCRNLQASGVVGKVLSGISLSSPLQLKGLDVSKSSLNPSQFRVSKTFIDMKSGILLVEGPPGTGKSTVIVETIIELLKIRQRILVCAPTNFEVQHLASKYLDRGDSRVAALVCSLEKIPTDSKLAAICLPTYTKCPTETERHRFKLSVARVIFCTVCTSGCNLLKDAGHFGSTIIDEAARAVEAELLIPLSHYTEKMMLVGDTRQLVREPDSKSALKLNYGRSIMNRFAEMKQPHLRLEEQYRMTPEISRWPAQYIYEGLFQDSSFVKKRKNPYQAPFNIRYLQDCSFVHADGVEEKYRSRIWNQQEAHAVVWLVERLLFSIKRDALAESVVILAFYNGQVRLINDMLSKKGLPALAKTVDSYQGKEADIVILSFTRSNERKNIGFLKNPRRLNVALTRARFLLVMIGNIYTYLNSDTKHMTDFLADIEQRNRLFHFTNLESAQVVRSCKLAEFLKEKDNKKSKDEPTSTDPDAAEDTVFEATDYEMKVVDDD